VDVVAPFGTPIVATARGQVRFVGYSGAYGLSIEIDHGHGVMTRYAHASRAFVHPGQQVERGDTIARIGRSGLAVGSHVHYEVVLNGVPRNPRLYINRSINPD
jgi:murein DD-endopeptidase MepM/ murein hydrolase activator NlpD